MNRRTFLTQCTMATAGLTTLLQGCQSGDTRSALAADSEAQGPAATDASRFERPPIDSAAATRFETATFAMG